ncbi:hypothetical protein [Bowmanella dokdonensis]|uniref:Uncharacterized protein n=1 Tax=Bowmanella dokdonensis TaxID=751969 RepID=A0A939DS79_9ALTE|nr:hypothetical protein [Bowmanella dokdonensis]MBN7826986.1 hypothetical protein [Bowmanella dokdonensis]
MPCYAVLTGDLVDSSQVPANHYDTLLYNLDQTLIQICDRFSGSYNIYRGDAFQLLLNQPDQALHAALLIRLSLKSAQSDARISVGLGKVDNLRQDIKSATGEAFTLSGKGLEQMDHLQRLKISSAASEFQFHMELLLRFADLLVGKTTARQAAALHEYLSLKDNSHQQIARRMNTSRVNVTKLLNQGHYELLSEFIRHSQQLSGTYFNA